jgi:hypothetical protein
LHGGAADVYQPAYAGLATCECEKGRKEYVGLIEAVSIHGKGGRKSGGIDDDVEWLKGTA